MALQDSQEYTHQPQLLDEPTTTELTKHQLVKGIKTSELFEVFAHCRMQQLERDEVLIRPGEKNTHLFLLMSGNLRVHLDHANSDTTFTIAPGESIGEMSIIEGQLTSAWVVADQPSTVVVMPENIFWNEFLKLPGAVKNLLNLLAQRMRQSNIVIVKALEERLRYEQVQRELETAGKIQASMLPQRDPLFPIHPEVDGYASMIPAKEVGGDFYDAFVLDEDRICVAIGDVSGKGLPAAMFMMRAMTLLRMTLFEQDSFADVLPIVNNLLVGNNDEFLFVTLCVAVLNVRTGRMTYANGGHNPPFASLKGSAFERLTMPKGILMGVDENADYPVAELDLMPGDTVVFYTDGINEAENRDQEFYGEEAACILLDQALQEGYTMREAVEALITSVYAFAGDAPQTDDITLLALRYGG